MNHWIACLCLEQEESLISTQLYLHFKLLFPFLLHYYERKEMPRQINSVKITLQLWHNLTKAKEIQSHCSHCILSWFQLWKIRCLKKKKQWNKLGIDSVLKACFLNAHFDFTVFKSYKRIVKNLFIVNLIRIKENYLAEYLRKVFAC